MLILPSVVQISLCACFGICRCRRCPPLVTLCPGTPLGEAGEAATAPASDETMAELNARLRREAEALRLELEGTKEASYKHIVDVISQRNCLAKVF